MSDNLPKISAFQTLTAAHSQRDAEFGHKLFLVLSKGSKELRIAARVTVDAWVTQLEKEQAEKGGAQ
jgi:hypothetical protein